MGTDIDYGGVAHKTIYDNINGGAGGGPVVAASDAWRAFAGKLAGIQEYVDKAVRGIGAAQQGASADAATRATMPLVPWVDSARQVAEQVARQVEHQEELFSYTKKTVPPVRAIRDPSFSEDPGAWAADGIDWVPGVHTQEEEDRRLAQQDEQYARELMTGYQANTNSNLETRPQFTPAPSVLGDLSQPALGDVGVQGGGGGGSYANSGVAGPGGGGYSAAPSPVSAAPQLASGGEVAGGGAAPHPGGTGVHTAPQQGGGPVGAPAAGARGPGAWLGGSAPLAPGIGGGGVGAGRGRTGSRFPAGGGAGRGGSAGGAGGGRFGGSGGSSGFGPQPKGPGAGGAAEQPSARGGGSGAAGARGGGTGMAGMAGAGAGRGRGGEDIEHQRPSYLIEQDEHAIVGKLPPVAPPVIGEDLPE